MTTTSTGTKSWVADEIIHGEGLINYTSADECKDHTHTEATAFVSEWMWAHTESRWLNAQPTEWTALADRVDPCQPDTPSAFDIIAYLRMLTETVLTDFNEMIDILDDAEVTEDLTTISWDYDWTRDMTGVRHDIDYAVHMYDLVDAKYN